MTHRERITSARDSCNLRATGRHRCDLGRTSQREPERVWPSRAARSGVREVQLRSDPSGSRHCEASPSASFASSHAKTASMRPSARASR